MRVAGRLGAGLSIAAWAISGLVALTAAQTFPAGAQEGARKTQAPEKNAPAAAPAPAQLPPMPSNTQLTLLIQLAMAAVAQANMTGNYTVLHALAAPSFQQSNPPDKLGQIFEGLRKSNVDIAPVLIYQPILTSQPSVTNHGLRLTGYYKTSPQNVLFDLLFVPVANQWRLFGIAINTRPDETVEAANQPKAAPAPAEKKAAIKK